MASNGAQNNIKTFFFVSHFFKEFFGQVRENSGKDHSHPQNFACSYSYVLHHHRFGDFLECFGTVLGIFGVAFVRALLLTTCTIFYTLTLLTRYCTMYYCNEHYQGFKLGGWQKAQHSTPRQITAKLSGNELNGVVQHTQCYVSAFTTAKM